MSVLNLDQSPQRDTLKVLLTLLVYEVGSGDSPALSDLGKRHRASCWQVEVVGGAEGEVGEKFEVAYTVGTQLEVGGGDTVGWCALERLEVVEVDGTRETECFEFALDLWAVEGLARRECDTSCSVVEGVLVFHIRCVLVQSGIILLLGSLAHEIVKVDRCITLVLDWNGLVAMPRLARLVYCAGLNRCRRRNLSSRTLSVTMSSFQSSKPTLRRFVSPKGDRRYEAIVSCVYTTAALAECQSRNQSRDSWSPHRSAILLLGIC